jgi:putative transcriptional regulator
MLDHATSSLPPALMLAGELHVHLSRQGAEVATVWDAVGGALLENSAPVKGDEETRRGRARKTPYLPVADILARDFDQLRWRRGLSGVRHARAGVRGGAFMRLEPGQFVPAHGHSVTEATVVLRGELQVAEGNFTVGDLVIGVPGQSHRPGAGGPTACICFVARAPKRFWRLS